jgi:hypothetical protein
MHLNTTLDERAPRTVVTTPPPAAIVVAPGMTAPAAAVPLFDLGGAERRMHARAYGQWVSVLHGRTLPSIADIDPATVTGFATHGVLLDFTQGTVDPRIAHIGSALREECGLDDEVSQVSQVPPRSLLARLTDHHRRIVADRAPVGFEAEFVGVRGRTTLYRGILMPLSSPGGDAVDYVYGVINGKEVADPAVQARLDAELGAAILADLHGLHDAPIWADGPHAGELAPPADAALPAPATPAEALAAAREAAARLRTADLRRRTMLTRALGHAYDLSLASEPGSGAAIVALVFGEDHDPVQRAAWAAVLDHARRSGVAVGRLPGFIDGAGGIDAIAATERAEVRRRG